ncbi:MAG: OmpH family outer membrane protein [Bacteroidota bacterium]
MKLVRNLLLVLVLFMGVNFAQAQKVAHIDSEKLLMAMPEAKTMESELKKLSETYAAEYKTQATALQAKLKKYSEEAATQTDVENGKRQKEVEELQLRIQKYGQTADQEIQKKRFDLLKPILEKAQNAVNAVAKEKGFQYVLDSSPGKGLLVYEGEDLLSAVKTKLGL